MQWGISGRTVQERGDKKTAIPRGNLAAGPAVHTMGSFPGRGGYPRYSSSSL